MDMGLAWKKGIGFSFTKGRSWFLLAFLLLLSVSGGLFFWQSMSISRNKVGLFHIEKAEISLSSWEGMPPTERSEIEADLTKKIEEIVSFPLSGRTLSRFLLLKGRYELLVKGNLDLALESFSKVRSLDYQYALALLYSAFIYEVKGKSGLALQAYQELANLKDPIFRAQGVFYQAVLKEKEGEVDLAKSLYASLAEDYAETAWGRLSKNRLLYLELEDK